MSADDRYTIVEREDGKFDLYHSCGDVDDYGRKLSTGLTIRQATLLADMEPTEYGYWIAWREPVTIVMGEDEYD